MVMGIVNITPDSFSDGGQCFTSESAVTHALRLEQEGAEIIDIGGESTRPRAEPVPEAKELRRVVPVIEALAAQLKVPISIDTMKPAVARAALEAGASIVNDVAANREDETMWRIIADFGAGYVCMHMQGAPQTMQINPCYKDVVQEVHEFFQDRIQRLKDCGVNRDQLILDPGLGFGKTAEHNLELLARSHSFKSLERPLLLGVSRKSFISKVLGTKLADRLPAALACASLAVESGVELIRAHDVSETLQAVRMIEAIVKLR